MLSGRIIAVLAAAAGGATLVAASPTQLFLIPIADILKNRAAFIDLFVTGTERNVSKGYGYSQAGTFGLFDRMELGFTNDFLGNSTWDVKVQIFESPPEIPGAALSIGVEN